MTTMTIERNDIRDAIRDAMKEIWTYGDGWAYARVYPDGHVSTGREVSQSIPEAEYFRRDPRPVTFFSRTAKPGDRYTQWMEDIDGLSDEEIADRIEDAIGDLDLDEEMDAAIEAIEEAGYEVSR